MCIRDSYHGFETGSHPACDVFMTTRGHVSCHEAPSSASGGCGGAVGAMPGLPSQTCHPEPAIGVSSSLKARIGVRERKGQDYGAAMRSREDHAMPQTVTTASRSPA